MGIYELKCSKCNNSFLWWSGDKISLCSKCINNMGGGYYQIERKYKNTNNCLVGCYYFIGFNEAQTYEEAVNYLIKSGVPEDEIVKFLDKTF